MSGDAGGLVEFLLARLAEDEAVTERAIKSYQHVFGIPHYFDPAPGEFPSSMVGMTPYAARAEVEAKRRIVELHREYLIERLDDEFPGDSCDALCDADSDDFPCPTLRLLALPYADHEHYRQEWRP